MSVNYRLIAAYAIVSAFNFGAINADIQAQHFHCSTVTVRGRLAMATFLSLIPVAGTAVAIFTTGFLEHGWTLKPGACE